MSCGTYVDYLYFDCNMSDSEIIDFAIDMIYDCLNHIEINECENELKEVKEKIKEKLGDGIYE